MTGEALILLTLLSLLFPLHAQLLHPIDMLALRSIKESMGDLPGGSFFSSWVFSLTVNPCQSFSGVQCMQVDNFNRVNYLSLGPQTAGLPGLSGSLTPSLGALAYLESLTISAGALRGTIPDSIGNLQNLQIFSCNQNYLSGNLPSSFANLRNLQVLQLRRNQLGGQIPWGIGALSNLQVFILSDNQFSGPIPTLSSTSLTHLDLRNNALTGGLPNLPPSLQYLCLTKNRISGQIDSLVSLSSLTYLDLSSNQFSGNIPSEVFAFPLSFLMLNRNQLSGAVQVMGQVKIPVVDLSHNHLQGGITPYLAGAQSLFLNNNQFVGAVPQVRSSLSLQLPHILAHNGCFLGTLNSFVLSC